MTPRPWLTKKIEPLPFHHGRPAQSCNYHFPLEFDRLAAPLQRAARDQVSRLRFLVAKSGFERPGRPSYL